MQPGNFGWDMKYLKTNFSYILMSTRLRSFVFWDIKDILNSLCLIIKPLKEYCGGHVWRQNQQDHFNLTEESPVSSDLPPVKR